MRHTIFNPRLASKLSKFYPLKVTIREPGAVTQSESGQKNATWADHLVDLPSALQPVTQLPGLANTLVNFDRSTHLLEINGYHPTITDRMEAVFDGHTWQIERVDWDTMSTLTYLYVWRR